MCRKALLFHPWLRPRPGKVAPNAYAGCPRQKRGRPLRLLALRAVSSEAEISAAESGTALRFLAGPLLESRPQAARTSAPNRCLASTYLGQALMRASPRAPTHSR